MKIHCMVAALVVIAGLILGLSVTEWCICLGLFGMVMALELVNTAVEAVVDLVTEERHRRTDHFCFQGTWFSGNMTGTVNFVS